MLIDKPLPPDRPTSPHLRRVRFFVVVALLLVVGLYFMSRASTPAHIAWHPRVNAQLQDERLLVKVGTDRISIANEGALSPVQFLLAPGKVPEISDLNSDEWNAIAVPTVFFDAPKYLSARPRRVATSRLSRASGTVVAQVSTSPDGTKIAVLSTTREYRAPAGGLLIGVPSFDGPEGWPDDFYVDILSHNGWFRAGGPWRLDGTSGPVGAPEIRWLSDQSGVLAFHAERGTWWMPTPELRLATPQTPK